MYTVLVHAASIYWFLTPCLEPLAKEVLLMLAALCGIVGFIVLLLPASMKKCLFCCCSPAWKHAEDHSQDLSYYVAQRIFSTDEKYHLTHPVYRMINRKFPEVNPTHFDKPNKVSKKEMAAKMAKAKIDDADTAADTAAGTGADRGVRRRVLPASIGSGRTRT